MAAFLPATVVVAVTAVPLTVRRPLNSMSAAFTPGGSAKKSAALVALPKGVVMAILPEAASVGTMSLSWVDVGLLASCTTVALKAPIVALLSSAPNWKLVPAMVTTVSLAPIWGVKLVMVGAGTATPTTKLVALAALPAVVLTEIAPVVAPVGTLTVSELAVAALTTAVVPLNLTVLLASVVLKPEPTTVTVVPTGPALGLKSETEMTEEACFLMLVMLPAAS